MYEKNAAKKILQNNAREKLSSRVGLWTAILYYSLFNLIGIGIGTIILFVLLGTNLGSTLDLTREPPLDGVIIFNLVINAIVMLILGGIVCTINRKTPFISLPKQFTLTKSDCKVIGITLLVIISFIGALELIVYFIYNNMLTEQSLNTPYNFLNSSNLSILILATVIVTFFAPFVEEVFYRWSMIRILKQGFSLNATILFSAFIFAFAHSAVDLTYSFAYFIIHFIATFMIGIIFALVFLKTEKVFPTILLHGIWNFLLATNAFFNYAKLEKIFHIIFTIIVCTCCVSLITLIIYFSIRKKVKGFFTITQKNDEQQNLETADEVGLEHSLIKKNRIRLKWFWFEIVLAYFTLICIIPLMLTKIGTYFSRGESILPLLYILLLFIGGLFILMRLWNVMKESFFQKQEDNGKLSNE